jgi:hypothetical protein
MDLFKKIGSRLLKEYVYKEGIKLIWQSLDSIYKATFRRGTMTGNNPKDKSKRGQAKRHILTYKKEIPLAAVITSFNKHDIKAVTVAIYNAVIELPAAVTSFLSITKTKRTIRRQHLCLERAYYSKFTK